MNRNAIATKLLTLLASGGTFDRTVADLPMFKPHMEAALDWLKSSRRCSAVEVQDLAVRLGEIIRQKDDAIRHLDFDLAAKLRSEECALFESFWLQEPTGFANTVLHVGVDEQMRQLSAFFMTQKRPKSPKDRKGLRREVVSPVVSV